MDRRGFGGSGDTADYAIEHEYKDVAAVVAQAARRTGRPVAVFGHSYGANCALGAAVESDVVSHLVLYEPSLGLAHPQGSIETIEAELARGDRDAAVTTTLETILGMSSEEIQLYRQSPRWPDRVRDAHTIPRECVVEQGRSFISMRWAVRCPTVVMTGSHTSDDLAAIARDAVVAIDNAQLRVLQSQGHMAPQTAPDLMARELTTLICA
jgi:pimeloyl-ACP methyl ester carboxylesterase